MAAHRTSCRSYQGGRELLTEFPAFQPERFVTSSTSGRAPQRYERPGNTDRVRVPYPPRFEEAMQRERLDGRSSRVKGWVGTEAILGRWGILTNDGQPKPIYHAPGRTKTPDGMLPGRCERVP